MSVGFASMALACAWPQRWPVALMSSARAAPGLPLYFAPQATAAAKPAPLWKLGGGVSGGVASRLWRFRLVGRMAERSKGGGTRTARDGGHERSHVPRGPEPVQKLLTSTTCKAKP